MKKIAILIPQFYWGGMPRVASHLIKLLENKYQITLILVNSNLEIRVDTYNARIKRLIGKPSVKFINLRMFLKKESFQAVISFGIIDNILNIINTPKNTKVIITEHSTKSFDNAIEPNWMKKLFYTWAIKHLYPKAHAIVAVSGGIKADLESKYGLKNIRLIYNPIFIDNQEAPLSDEDAQLIDSIKSSGGEILINVGRITRPKGQMNLIHMMNYIKKYNIHLILVGEGPDVEQLKKVIESKKLSKYIHLVGTQSNVSTWMKLSDFYVSLSWFEGFPTALIESLYSGTPVISADIFSGPREILSNGHITNYKEKIKYPRQFNNGILTNRFDFRKKKINLNKIERDFAAAVLNTIYSKPIFDIDIDFINNNLIRNEYEKLIEDK